MNQLLAQEMSEGLLPIHRGLKAILGSFSGENFSIRYYPQSCQSESLVFSRPMSNQRVYTAEITYDSAYIDFAQYCIHLKNLSSSHESQSSYSDGMKRLSRGELWFWLARMVASPDRNFDPHKSFIESRTLEQIYDDAPPRLKMNRLSRGEQLRLERCRNKLEGLGEPFEIDNEIEI